MPIHQTEIIKKTLDPVWAPFVLSLQRWCKNDPTWPLIIECYDWDQGGSDDLIGMIHTTYGEMFNKNEFEIINPGKQKKKGYKHSGMLHIKTIQEFKLPSFVDYIKGGTEVCLVVGIDYTASNGDITEKTSLHYQNPNGTIYNPYVAATKVVGEVLSPYDSDKLYPAFGFGAKLVDLGNQTSHCFPINFNNENPNCAGIDGILEAYVNSFDDLTLAGPTNFTPIINIVTKMAEEATKEKKGSKYFILLMITDGEVQDMTSTVEAIKKATNLPISIIIVGVGENDFDKMTILDADQKAKKRVEDEKTKKKREKEEKEKEKLEQKESDMDLKSSGKKEPKKEEKKEAKKEVKKEDKKEEAARKTVSSENLFERDIVQFVPFNVFKEKPLWQLAKHTLTEVPKQLIQYMSKNHIEPLNPVDAPIGGQKKDTLFV